MKLVITGGTGLIGRALCRALEAAGQEGGVLTRSAPRSASGRGRFVVWQPPSAGPWERELDGADGLINLAGESVAAARWTPAQKQRLIDSRLSVTRALVGAISKARCKPAVLISASAVGYYGPRGDDVIREHDAPGEDFLAKVCHQWEAAAYAARGHGVRVACLRIGLVLARDGGALARMLPAFRLGLGGPLGNGRQWVSWIHRDDLIGLIRWVLKEPRASGALNATAPNPVTMREFATSLGRALHRPALAPVPAWMLRLMLGEMADMLLTGQQAIPEVALNLRFIFRYPMLSGALEACLSVRPETRGTRPNNTDGRFAQEAQVMRRH